MALAIFTDESGVERLVGFMTGEVVAGGDGQPYQRVTPSFIGQLYTDNTNGGLYIAVGLTANDWLQLGGMIDNAHSQAPGINFQAGGETASIQVGAFAAGVGGVVRVSDTDSGDIYPGGTHGTTDPAAAPAMFQLTPFGTILDGVTLAGQTTTLSSGVGSTIAIHQDVETYTPVTFTPTAGAAATCLIELSPDDVTYAVIGTETVPAGVALDGFVRVINVRVPTDWFLRLTVTHATLGDTLYY